MELEYVAKAVRRFWPVVLLSLVLGILAGQFLQPSSDPRYEAVALLHVAPAADSALGSAADDRYVASQLVVLESPPMAARAAELAGVSMSEAQLAAATTFAQIPGTDVVRIVASSSSPEDAQAIANGYLDAYVEQVEQTSGDNQGADPTRLEETVAAVERQLGQVDQRIQNALAPYVQASESDPEAVIPTIEQVAPAIATQREVLLETYRELLRQRTTLEFEPEPTNSPVIQRAELPTDAIVESSRVLTLAITLVSVLFGVVIATVLARTSRRVLDGAEAAELLGVPFAATVPSERSLRARSLHQLQHLPPGYRAVVNELCVQVEARGVLDTSLNVLVTGSQRVSGTTTLAAGIAARFGEVGSKVVLVDLDFDQPDLSKCFGVEGDGLSALVFGGANGDGTTDHRLDGTVALTPTPLPNVSVVGRQPGFGQARPQRAELLAALDMAAEHGTVVIIDAGPMLAAPAAAVLAPHTDAVVLAVPVWSQERSALRVVARQLAGVKAHILPVAMPRLKRSHRLPVSATVTASTETGEREVLAPTAH